MQTANLDRTLAKPTRAEAIAKSRAEKRIDAAYHQTCCGIQIDVMDIGKVFKRGHELIAQGADDKALAAGILAFVQTIAK